MTKIREEIAWRFGDDLLLLDPPEQFDHCILGVASRCGMEPTVVYDQACIVKALEDDGMENEDAVEHFDFNIHGSYVGPTTPLYLEKVGDDGEQ